jgi:hypothetical protein
MINTSSMRLFGAATLLILGVAAPAAAQSRTTDRDDAPRSDRAPASGGDIKTSLGMSVSLSGSDRDTLGVLISGVTPDGVADRAGVADGNRLAAINGVSLRIEARDVGDRSAEDAILRNLARELREARAGDDLTLRIFSGGRYRNVTVQAPDAPRTRTAPSRVTNDDDGDVPATSSPTTISAVIDGLARLQTQLTRIAPSCSASGGSGDTIAGLGLSAVAPELAAYFGEGAENGLLVLRASDSWSPLRPGDVILRIDGDAVTTARLRALGDGRGSRSVEVLRRKRVIEVILGE